MSDQETNKMDLENLDKPRRRFVGLTVREVSLVDSGANEREFAIIKRKGGNGMADEIKREKQAADSTDVVKTETPDNDTVEPTKEQEPTATDQQETKQDDAKGQETAEVEKLAGQVEQLLSKVEELEKAKATDKADADVEKAGLKELMMRLKEAKMALGKNDVKAAMAAIDAAMKLMGSYGGGGYPAAAKKAEDADVEKAGAKMSKARVEKLDNIFKQMETAFTTLKELLADVRGSMDTDKSATIEVDTTKAADQIKAAVEPVTKALEGFTEQIKTLAGRVEAIEKARGVSKGADDGQEDVTKQKGGNGTFWAGTAVAGVGAKGQQ